MRLFTCFVLLCLASFLHTTFFPFAGVNFLIVSFFIFYAYRNYHYVIFSLTTLIFIINERFASHQITFDWSWLCLRLALVIFVYFLVRVIFHRRLLNYLNLFYWTPCFTLLGYLFTNTFAWYLSPVYSHTWSGWLQTQTIGDPHFSPPAYYFLLGDVILDIIFAYMLFLGLQLGRPYSFTFCPLDLAHE